MKFLLSAPWALLFVCCVSSTVAEAEAFPAHPIYLIVGFPAGGGADLLARLIAPELAECLGQPVVVENRPGATGTVASGIVARSKPDGYTLLLGANSTNAIAPAVYRSLPYDEEKDLTGVALLVSVPHVISVYRGSGIQTLNDLVVYAKAHPGTLTYASPGYGSAPHLAGEIFNRTAGTHLVPIQYQGTAYATDLISGRITVSFDTTATILPYVKAGQLRPLAVTSSTRFSLLPNVPTAKEAGVPAFEFTTWMGVFAPHGTPQAVLERLNYSFGSALANAGIREKLLNQLGADVPKVGSAHEFDLIVRKDIERFRALVRQVGIRIN